MSQLQQADNEAVNLDLWEPGEKSEWATELEQRIKTNIKSIEQDPGLFLESFTERLPYLMLYVEDLDIQ